MVFNHFLGIRLLNAALAAGLLSVGLAIADSANASVLVKPSILSDTDSSEPTETTDTSQSIVDIAATTAEFSTLAAAVQAANLNGILASDGPFTVFAPTDAAFSALPPGTLDSLLLPENRDLLVKLLYNHVAYGDTTADQLTSGEFETFDGTVAVAVLPSGVTVDGANVVQADVDATNGVIHAVDQVLLPTGFTDQLQARTTDTPTSSATTSTPAQVTRTTDLQQGAIDRTTTAVPVAPPRQPEAAAPARESAIEPIEPAAAAPASDPEVQEPVRGLW
ncbi:MAG: fasciclin domain-containing protein [Phormidesmis sp.]